MHQPVSGSQQPPAHEVGVHAQTPPTHARPWSHCWHALPPLPQVSAELPGVHTLPAQQPPGHELASHTQAVPLQRCPAPQAAALPQPQLPSARQVFEVLVLQLAQVTPLRPQAPVVGAVQVVPLQQPLAHDAPSHTHAPPEQRWPAPHAALLPQRHAPPLHPSAFDGSQATHAAPLAPHCALVGALQVLPAQQPPAQVAALQPSHAWFTHVIPVHAAQATPPVPQAAVLVPAWQRWFASQQPLGHELALHTH